MINFLLNNIKIRLPQKKIVVSVFKGDTQTNPQTNKQTQKKKQAPNNK